MNTPQTRRLTLAFSVLLALAGGGCRETVRAQTPGAATPAECKPQQKPVPDYCPLR